MHAYLRPSGLNGSRFNSRLAKTHKAAWRALKLQRAADLQLLEGVREFICSGRGMSALPQHLHSKVLMKWSDPSRACEVLDRSTLRLIGRVTRLGVWPC